MPNTNISSGASQLQQRPEIVEGLAYPCAVAGAPSQQQTLTRLAHALIRICGEDGERFAADLSLRLKEAEESILLLCEHAEHSTPGARNPKLAEETERELMKAVAAADHFDRISQRLNHILSCLTLLEAPVAAADIGTASERKIRVLVRAGLAMERDRTIFDAIQNGASVQGALHATRGA